LLVIFDDWYNSMKKTSRIQLNHALIIGFLLIVSTQSPAHGAAAGEDPHSTDEAAAQPQHQPTLKRPGTSTEATRRGDLGCAKPPPSRH